MKIYYLLCKAKKLICLELPTWYSDGEIEDLFPGYEIKATSSKPFPSVHTIKLHPLN